MKKAVFVAVLLILAAGLLPAQDDSAYFWAGGYFDESSSWHDTIYVTGGEWLDIPVYFYGGPDVWVADLAFPLGAEVAVIDSFNMSECSANFWPFNAPMFGWNMKEFGHYSDDILDEGEDYANPAGYHSLSFIGVQGDIGFPPPLQADSVIQILSFSVHVANSDSLAGHTYDLGLQMGYDWHYGPMEQVGDTLGGIGYPVSAHFAKVSITNVYDYLPGDVNMYVGLWPPSAIGSDVTYLVNYFRSTYYTNAPCFLDGFWASADVNGDCNVIGSDVTRLVSYFRSQAQLQTCPSYPPLWPTSQDLPTQPPPGWPNCDELR